MIDVHTEFCLAPDVELIAARDITERQRQAAGCDAEDFVLSRTRSRARSKVISATTLPLLRQFQTPRSLLAAIDALRDGGEKSPEALVDACLPVLVKLINDDFLIPKERLNPSPRAPSFNNGAEVEGFTVLRSIQLFEDTELYKVRDKAGRIGAMKIARQPSHQVSDMFAREASLCRLLDGRNNPALLAEGSHEHRPYLVVAWRNGQDVAKAADHLRGREAAAPKLLALAISVAEAYAHLHGQGVIHGDVHPRNVLVDDDGRVTIIDFGLSRLIDGPDDLRHAPRGGVAFFFDPGLAAARRSGATPPQADAASEQYSVAALLYLLLSGRQYLDFSYDQETAFRQICEERPRAFMESRATSWPDVENVLSTALEKSPDRRFASMAELASRLKGLKEERARSLSHKEAASSAPRHSASLDLLLAEIIAELGPGSRTLHEGLVSAPLSSVHSGASGIAHALSRIAAAREDPILLAVSDVWSQRALHDQDDPKAYFDPVNDVTERTVGRASLTHSSVGSLYVAALIKLASGGFVAAQRAIDTLVAQMAQRDCPNPDLFSGRAGHLAACATLLEASRHARPYLELDRLREMGDHLASQLWDACRRHPPIGSDEALDMLGAAHGWSGILYALLRWSQATGVASPTGLPDRLDELATFAVPCREGVRWPIRLRPAGSDVKTNHMSGWCNGGAGHVQTWLLAHAMFKAPRYLDLAIQSGSQALADSLPRSAGFLCCGMTGVAYALLGLYRATAAPQWRDRAHRLAETAVSGIESPKLFRYSLFRGAMGLALLRADLDNPRDATMPVFGPQ